MVDRLLFEHFLRVRRRARGAMVCVNDRTIFTNAAAARLVDDGARDELWAWARRAIAMDDVSMHELAIGALRLDARCEGIRDGAELIGAVIRLERHWAHSRDARASHTHRSFGWHSLRDSELGIAQLVADGLTNREVGEELFLSRHTVDFHLRQIFRKLDISSRVELTRLVVERSRHGDEPTE
jgi:DNA-binding CsgD family transcriptional regulator